MISAVAAMSTNRVIGRDNGLPWNIPEDLKFFREVTRGGIVIMGRKTFDSIKKPLPNRLNIVITRDATFSAQGTVVFTEVDKSIEFARKELLENPTKWAKDIFIIGGAEIYKLAMPYTDRIYLTEIHAEIEGDTFFPEFDKSVYKEISRDRRNGEPSFDFVIYQR